MLSLKQYKFSIHKNIKSYSGVHNCLINKKLIYKVCMRTMISSKSFYAIRALFNTAMMLSNTEMVDKINRQNTRPFVESAVDLALDHDKGALQHKTAILKHATNHKFPAHEFYEYFRKQTGYKNMFKKAMLSIRININKKTHPKKAVTDLFYELNTIEELPEFIYGIRNYFPGPL